VLRVKPKTTARTEFFSVWSPFRGRPPSAFPCDRSTRARVHGSSRSARRPREPEPTARNREVKRRLVFGGRCLPFVKKRPVDLLNVDAAVLYSGRLSLKLKQCLVFLAGNEISRLRFGILF
jgi:hypothetical protein